MAGRMSHHRGAVGPNAGRGTIGRVAAEPAIRRVVLAAGGTAGHVFPALAVYRRLRSQGVEVTLLTDERGKRWAGDFAPDDVQLLPSGGIVTGSPVTRIRNGAKLGLGLVKSFGAIRRLDPDAVIGMGGYAAVGPLLAAQVLRRRNVLHEQNSVMGASNKVTAPRADAVALSFDPTEGARGATVVTGNPSRTEIVAIGDDPFVAPAADEPFGVLIMGGSQGATVISSIVPTALAGLPESARTRLRVTHQARAEDQETVTTRYAEAGIKAEVMPFVDVPQSLSSTHLVISRSGASTVCDIAVARRAAIYLPLLSHADLQQVKNARGVVEAGGAMLIREDDGPVEQVATAMTAMIKELVDDQVQLEAMSDAARAWSRPDAVDAILSLVGQSAQP